MSRHDTHPNEESILAYVNGECSEDTELADHLEHCTECQSSAASLRILQARLAQDTMPKPLRPFWPAVHARLHGTRQPQLRPTFALGSLATAVGGILLGIFIGSAQEAPTEPLQRDLWSMVGATVSGESGAGISDSYTDPYEEDGD